MEIERKWLIDKNNIPYDLSKAPKYSIEQAYISFEPQIRIRKINDGENYNLTMKTKTKDGGIARNEYELPINEYGYNLLVQKAEGKKIKKDRYKIKENDLTLEIDLFKDDFEGLACLEIEFPTLEEAKAYRTPNWVIKDVTDDVRYKNGYLAQYGKIKEGE